jgi:tetratricopeptide (TPR) repeat protein
MKTVIVLIVLVSLPLLMQAQAPCLQEYKGEITLYTNKGRLPQIPIVIDGNQGPLSDANGIFRYRLNKCPGMTVRIKLGGNNWDIVNHSEIYSYTIRQLADPSDFQFKLIVAQVQDIEKARRQYYATIAGVALDKGLTSMKGDIKKLTDLVVDQQRLMANGAKKPDVQPQPATATTGALEQRLQQQQKEYQRVLDSLVKAPAMLTSRINELQKLLGKQQAADKQLIDSLGRGGTNQKSKIAELEKILDRQRQENQQLLTKLVQQQDSTRQNDKSGELRKLVEQQKQENQRLLDSLGKKELAWQKSRQNELASTEKNKTIEQLRDSLSRMQNRYEQALSERDKQLSEAQAMAAVFAKQTAIDSTYQKAFLQYKEGQFANALSALDDDMLIRQSMKKSAQVGSGAPTGGASPSVAEQPNRGSVEDRAVYIGKCLLKANIYRSQYDMEQAAHWYEEAIQADPTQVENILTYANFLQQLNRPQEPGIWYQKALDLNPPAPLKADINVELGYYHIANNRFDEAEAALQQAKTLRQQLARTNPEQNEPGLAHVLDGLGTLYSKKRQFDDAEKAFVQAKNIREKLVEKYADEFEADLAFSLNNLGTFYYINKRLGDAGKTYLRAKTIQDRLVRRNADQYEPDLASTLNNLGTLNSDLERIPDAETAYKQSKAIREKLAQKNPDLYEPSLAQVLNDLGDLYTLTKRYPEAEASYQQAKTIREKLAQKNPDQFEGDLAQTLTDIGNFYRDTKRYPEAEATYTRAKTIQQKLAGKFAELFEPTLAMTLGDMGFFYTEMKRYPEAEALYQEAKTIQEKLAKKKPIDFEPDLVYTLMDMGNLYFDTERPREAKGAYVRTKDILERLAATDGGQSTSLQIQVLHRLALLSDAQERSSYFLEADSLQQKVVELVEKQFGDADSALMARELSNWSYHSLFSRKFAKAQSLAEKSLSFDDHESWVNANLAMAYLMQGKLDDAKSLYTYLKNKPHRSGRYKKTFLADLDELEAAGLTHPDMAIIRKLLNQ